MMGKGRLRRGWQTDERSNISLKLIFIANFWKGWEISLSDCWNWKCPQSWKVRNMQWHARPWGRSRGEVWSWISLLMSSFVARWTRTPALCSCQISTAAELWLIALQRAQINCPDREGSGLLAAAWHVGSSCHGMPLPGQIWAWRWGAGRQMSTRPES